MIKWLGVGWGYSGLINWLRGGWGESGWEYSGIFICRGLVGVIWLGVLQLIKWLGVGGTLVGSALVY